METLEDLQVEWQAIVDRQQALINKADAEKRGLTEREEREYNYLNEDFKEVHKIIKEFRKNPSQPPPPRRKPCKPWPGGKPLTEEEKRELLNSMHTNGVIQNMENRKDEFRYDPNSHELRHSYNRWVIDGPPALTREEYRALQTDIPTAGGFMVAPVEVGRDYIRRKENFVILRRIATQMQLENAISIRRPALDNEIADPTWTAEIATGTLDSSMNFDARDLYPHPLAKRIKVSETLLRVAPAAETVVRDSMAYKFGITEENCFLNGTGQNQPLGVFTPSAAGINVDRDITTEATSVHADDIINVIGNQKAQYRNGTSVGFIMSRYWQTVMMKLKDGEGRFLWTPSLSIGQPDRLMGFPVWVSEYSPTATTSGSYVLCFGDYSFYWIVDLLQFRIQRLTELYAESNEVGFIGRQETDGMPILSEAFTRLKLK